MVRGAGAFNRTIACDEPIRDDANEITGFAETFTASADIAPLTGRERLQTAGINAEMDTRIRIRWSRRNARIDATWRLRYKDTIYNIAAPPIDIDMAHREIELFCKSGLNVG